MRTPPWAHPRIIAYGYHRGDNPHCFLLEAFPPLTPPPQPPPAAVEVSAGLLAPVLAPVPVLVRVVSSC